MAQICESLGKHCEAVLDKWTCFQDENAAGEQKVCPYITTSATNMFRYKVRLCKCGSLAHRGRTGVRAITYSCSNNACDNSYGGYIAFENGFYGMYEYKAINAWNELNKPKA